MNNINEVLSSIQNIDDSTLMAEGNTISVYESYIDKMTMIIKHAENINDFDFVQEAKSVGTGVMNNSGGHSLISRIWTFIRKVVHAIINKISDLLTKIKIHNYEYVEIPMSYEDVKSDVDLFGELWDSIGDSVKGQYVDAIDERDWSKDIADFKKILQKVGTLKILKAGNDGKRYGIKPDVFMKMRDKLRFLQQELKDVSKSTDNYIKGIEKRGGFDNKQYEQYCRLVQQTFAKMHEASTKLFASFKFKNTTKMDAEVEIVKKFQEIDNGLNQLREIVKESFEYDIDDGEWIDETEKPFDEWLKKHDYDSSNNTIMLNGKRHDAGKVPSKKERNRINRFLRENNYDPKTETIQTDIKNKDGSNKRIKFNMIMDNSNSSGPAYYFNPDVNPEINPDLKEASINVKSNVLGTKPRASNQIFKHEEGHVNQMEEGKGGRKTSLFGGDYGYLNSSDENAKDIEKFQSQDGKNVESDAEHDADLYGYQHNPYAKELTKDNMSPVKDVALNDIRRTSMNDVALGRRKALKDENAFDAGRDAIMTDIIKTRQILKSLDKDIKVIRRMLQQDDNYIKSNSAFSREELLKDLNTNINDIQILKDKLDDYEEELRKLDGDKGLSEYKKSERYEKYKTSVKKDINDFVRQLDLLFERAISVFNIRGEYLSQHADEAGSKARKLEGRQGKHKGKHK